jgi:plasmid maintenance system antidote protein VapI
MGFPDAVLAAALGIHPMNFHTMLGQATVTVGTAQRVAALYDRAWNADPRAFGATARGITRTLARAAAAAWPSPLAWDDESLDDPAAVADLGARAGRTAALVEDVSWLMESFGYTRALAAERIGVTKATVDQAFTRVKRQAEAA